MSKKLEHARHNKSACEFLRDDGNYLDWVVTTAFYSAIHFVDHELFPEKYSDPDSGKIRMFQSFDHLYQAFSNSGGNTNQHKYRLELVNEHCPDFWQDFKTLKDNCWTARYKDYQIEPEIADLCVDCLTNIAEICEPLDN